MRHLSETIDYALRMFDEHPERDRFAAETAALDGRRRRYPCLSINHQNVPGDDFEPRDELTLPDVAVGDPVEAALARRILGLLEPLKLLNPVAPLFRLGAGTGTLVPAFGIPLNPETGNSPAFTRPVREIMAEPPPDPATAGLMPEIRSELDGLLARTPETFRIQLPDLQSPFNIAHAVAGEAVFLLPCEDRDLWMAFMDRITTFWLDTHRLLAGLIGEDRMTPAERRMTHISDCSCNLVSADFYREFVAPFDLRLAEAFPGIHMHHCSGPHVFRVTQDCLPNIACAECGYIAKTAAGYTEVDEVFERLGGKPVLIRIGQELPPGKEYELIRADLDRYAQHPRLLFGYTGMSWRRKDRPLIRDLHRRLDAYWDDHYAAGAS